MLIFTEMLKYLLQNLCCIIIVVIIFTSVFVNLNGTCSILLLSCVAMPFGASHFSKLLKSWYFLLCITGKVALHTHSLLSPIHRYIPFIGMPSIKQELIATWSLWLPSPSPYCPPCSPLSDTGLDPYDDSLISASQDLLLELMMVI